MARSAVQVAVAVLLAALATACLGGQTGQPSSLDCSPTRVSATAAWSGTTVQAAAQAFARTYTSALHWRVEARSEPTHTRVDLPDNAELRIAYAGAPAQRDCFDRLEVPVTVTLATSDSGLAESGEATLEISRESQGLEARLHFETKRIRLDATLPEPATGEAPLVTFDALDPDLPGASASFSEGP